MRRLFFIIISLFFWGLSFGERSLSAQRKTPQELFLEARNSYLYGNYADAIRKFRELLYPEPGILRSEALKREAHKYLGISYFYLAQRTGKTEYRDAAKSELLRYLLLAPRAKLDPLLYPPDLVSFFNQIRRDNARRLQAILRKRRRRRSLQPIQVIPIEIERRVYRKHFLLSLLPFGLSQFANGQTVKGAVLLAGEVLSLGLNIGAYLAIYSYQIKSGPQRGFFRQRDLNTVKAWQVVQFSSFGVFSALLIYGLIDGIVFFQPSRTSLIPVLPKITDEMFEKFNGKGESITPSNSNSSR